MKEDNINNHINSDNDVKKEKSVCNFYKENKILVIFVIGLIVGAIIAILISYNVVGNSKLASIDGKGIRERKIFNNMKNYYALSFILEEADGMVLNSLYKLTDEQVKEIDNEVNHYLNTYSNYYGYTEEQFLSENGFSSLDEFKEIIKLNYLRNLYYNDYLAKQIPEDDIKNYYENNVFGEIDSKHILVRITDEVTEEKALEKAKQIIEELNNGAIFDEVAEKYKDEIVFEELGYQGFNASLEESYMNALKALENDTYTKEPVQSSYGYHIIYKINQKEKPSLENAKRDIVEVLSVNLSIRTEESYNQALLELRNNNNFKIHDKNIQKVYDEYLKSIGAFETATENENETEISTETGVETSTETEISTTTETETTTTIE